MYKLDLIVDVKSFKDKDSGKDINYYEYYVTTPIPNFVVKFNLADKNTKAVIDALIMIQKGD